jgi:hypothetical protein
MGRLRLLLIPVLAAVAPVAAASASEPPQELGSVIAPTRIAAQGGWVVWSSASAGAFHLVAWHDGSETVLPVKALPQPFDVDVGTDARGHVTATFSRCTGKAGISPDGTVRATGCRVRVVDLASGVERTAGIPGPKGASDTNPSMWAGRIAFARHDPRRHDDVEQILLWAPGTRRLTVLPHGAVPTNCPFRHKRDCEGMPVSGTVAGLDLGADLVSFMWFVQGPAVVGHRGVEVRVDRLDTRRSVLVGSGTGGEACTGGPDRATPSIPTSDGTRVWYSQLTSECYDFSSALVSVATGSVARSTAPLAGIVLQVAKDGSNLYALVAPENWAQLGAVCAPASPCSVERIDMPALSPTSDAPASPFYSRSSSSASSR